jgi:hypothetical protein
MTSPFSHGSMAVSVSPSSYRWGYDFGVRRPYPADAIEYAAWFPDDEACADYLAWLRWGDCEFGCHPIGPLPDRAAPAQSMATKHRHRDRMSV